jgi:hypothetical protein
MKLIVYEDLISQLNEYNCWRPNACFPIHQLGFTDKGLLGGYAIREYIFTGIQSERSQEKFEALLTSFTLGVKEILNEDAKTKYLFVIEPEPKSISKVRTYKGLIQKGLIKDENMLENEFMLDETISRIASVAVVDNDNLDKLFNLFLDDATCFIISSKNDYLNKIFLQRVMDLVEMDRWSHIDMLKISMHFCPQGDFVYRVGGDGGEHYMSLQRIYHKTAT